MQTVWLYQFKSILHYCTLSCIKKAVRSTDYIYVGNNKKKNNSSELNKLVKRKPCTALSLSDFRF